MDITLGKFGPQDFDDYFRLVANPAAMAMITQRAIPADEVRRGYDGILIGNGFVSKKFKDFDDLPGEVLERDC